MREVLPRHPAPGLLSEEIIDELDELAGETLGSLVALYFDEAHRQLSEIAGAIGRGAAPAVRETAHQLKGSSGTMGAAHVAQLAAQLEMSARAGDLAAAGALLLRLRTALPQTGQAYRDRAGARTATQASSMQQIDSDRPAATRETPR